MFSAVTFGIPQLSAAGFDRVLRGWAEEFDVAVPLSVPCRWGHSSDRIYFACNETGVIKLGYSRDPAKRVKAFRKHELLAVTFGDEQFEFALHRMLRDFSLFKHEGGCGRRGGTMVHYSEWYRADSPVVTLAYRVKNAADSVLVSSTPVVTPKWRTP